MADPFEKVYVIALQFWAPSEVLATAEGQAAIGRLESELHKIDCDELLELDACNIGDLAAMIGGLNQMTARIRASKHNQGE